MSKRLIDLQHITKSFDGQMVLDDLNLYIRENEFLTLLGPSGGATYVYCRKYCLWLKNTQKK